jgi:hypothetical protein
MVPQQSAPFHWKQLPTGWNTTSFGRRSSPWEIKHVTETWPSSTSLLSTSYTVLESVLWKSLGWSLRSACLATPFSRLDALLFLPVGIHEGLGVSGDTAETRWTLTAHNGRCCFHTEQSWKNTESNTFCFKKISLVHSQCRRPFWTETA